ncbi:MAG: hypothetical protein R3287_04380 [Anderseniella sp.]|nr:hypothetical protein [Anderseniella sp.]
MSETAASGGANGPSRKSWSPSGIDHHESVESRGCVLTSLSDDRIIEPASETFWSPL